MTVITVVYADARSSCRASTISRTSAGRPHSHNRSMITASSSPKRRILTPEHGHGRGSPAVTYYHAENALTVHVAPLLFVFSGTAPSARPAYRRARRCGAATGEHNTFTIRVSRYGCYHRCSRRRAGRRPRCRDPTAVLALRQGSARLRRAVLPGPGECG